MSASGNSISSFIFSVKEFSKSPNHRTVTPLFKEYFIIGDMLFGLFPSLALSSSALKFYYQQ